MHDLSSIVSQEIGLGTGDLLHVLLDYSALPILLINFLLTKRDGESKQKRETDTGRMGTTLFNEKNIQEIVFFFSHSSSPLPPIPTPIALTF